MICTKKPYSLAVYGLLRPIEYMLTPRHNTFNKCRHMRACDIQFKCKGQTITSGATHTPDSFSVAIKISKSDHTHGGAIALIEATGLDTWPVKAMWSYFKQAKPLAEGPLFVSNGQLRTAVLLRSQSAIDTHRSRRLPLRPAQFPCRWSTSTGPGGQKCKVHNE